MIILKFIVYYYLFRKLRLSEPYTGISPGGANFVSFKGATWKTIAFTDPEGHETP